nr:hypothetical protein [Bacillota bacterium]
MRARHSVLAALIIPGLVIGSQLALAEESPWPCFKHDVRLTGRTEATRYEAPVNLWTFQTRGMPKSSPIIDPLGDIIVGFPMYLYSIEPQWGTTNWEFMTLSMMNSSPCVDRNGNIYFADSAGYATALNILGEKLWQYDIEAFDTFSPIVATDGNIYFGGHTFFAMRPDGSLAWHFKEEYDVFRITPAIGANDWIYVIAQRPGGEMDLVVLTPEGWPARAPRYIGATDFKAPVIGDKGQVYVTSPWILTAYDKDLNLTWTFPISAGEIAGSPSLGPDGTLYITTKNGYVYAVGKDGQEKWEIGLKDAIIETSPVITGDGNVHIVTNNGWLVSLNPDGDINWTWQVPGGSVVPPAIGADGTIYVAALSGRVLAIGSRTIGNHNPVLSKGLVSPTLGYPTTTFRFTVHYYDEDGNKPENIRVWIDNEPHEMSIFNGVPSDGDYRHNTNLPSGSHRYYFTATDGKGGWAMYPEGTSYLGPSVNPLRPWPTSTLIMETKLYRAGDTMRLYMRGRNPGGDIFVDFYLAAQMPNEDLLYYPYFTSVPTPWLTRYLLPMGWEMPPQVILHLTLPELPFGSYWWHAAFCNPDTTEPLGGIVSSID